MKLSALLFTLDIFLQTNIFRQVTNNLNRSLGLKIHFLFLYGCRKQRVHWFYKMLLNNRYSFFPLKWLISVIELLKKCIIQGFEWMNKERSVRRGWRGCNMKVKNNISFMVRQNIYRPNTLCKLFRSFTIEIPIK